MSQSSESLESIGAGAGTKTVEIGEVTGLTGGVGELSRQYEPSEIEGPLYREWLAAALFRPQDDPGGNRYSITIPPPNVTGELHMGHALCYTIHDVLVRWKRMHGCNTLCLPGTDHAGIATQNVVERVLAREGLSRHDLGREQFVERVWEWKEKYGAAIVEQMQELGCSFDWSRLRFTMDAAYSEAVIEAFIHLFNKGYIHRGTRVIHWCPRCRTALSDIEVDDQESAGRLWYFRYPIENGYTFGAEYVVIATTRPETMLGDTAVAVHPDDPRHRHLIGHHVLLPLAGRRIPIIGDPILVNPEFGAGALKVTPAHDLNDAEAAERNGLAYIQVIGPDGAMNESAGAFAGMDRFEAREAVVNAMEELGLLEKIEDHAVNLPICDRCKTILEPLLSEQWYCRMGELARPAIKAIQEGKIRFVPERWNRVCLQWLENLRDWCISRQLWWGHRIPVYQCEGCEHTVAARSMPEACEKCGSTNLIRDPDVLDTWFSSALWPFATLGWPGETPDLATYYPTNVLITSPDIIYLWVARMMMMGLEFMHQIPFPDVYIHATILDAKGDRMSKSKGNGINPLDLVAQFGADATRYGIVTQAGKSQQIRFSDNLVAQARLFCNKIWQASRFVLMNLEESAADPEIESGANHPAPFAAAPDSREPGSELPLERIEDRWIYSRLVDAIASVNRGLSAYDLDVATRVLHEFIWSEFCDWYIELAKPRLQANEATIRHCLQDILDQTLRLLHPFMPFLSEAIWQHLPGHGQTLTLARFPNVGAMQRDPEAERIMLRLMDIVVRVRNMKSELKVSPGRVVPVFLGDVPDELKPWTGVIENRARCSVSLEQTGTAGDEKSSVSYAGGVQVRIPLEGLVDFEKERERIGAEIATLQKELVNLERQLANPQFRERAPADVVREKEERLAGIRQRLAAAEQSIARLR